MNGAVTALLPQPRSIEYGDRWLPVTGRFGVEWLGHRNSLLDRAVSRLQREVARRTGVEVSRDGDAQLRIDCRGDDEGYLTVDARERYSLAVNDDGVTLTADAPAGVLCGLAALRQSITNVAAGFAIPAIVIDDATRFVWRGLMIDVARHFGSLPAQPARMCRRFARRVGRHAAVLRLGPPRTTRPAPARDRARWTRRRERRAERRCRRSRRAHAPRAQCAAIGVTR